MNARFGKGGANRPALATLAIAALLAGASLGVAASGASAQRRGAVDFEHSWRIPRGKAIEIKGVNGSVRAEPASGREVEVTATKRAKRSDPDEVEIQFVEHPGGVTVCAVYPGRGNRCAPGSKGRMNTRNNDVQVDFEVRVPEGVEFVGRTVNGAITSEDLAGPVTARTVNGSVKISTLDVAQATTVNGSIDVSIGRARWSDELEFSTVNGGITVECPGNLSTRVRAETVNGSISTDFPLTVRGRVGSKRISGRVGEGGGDLTLKTVNGSVRLRSAD